MRAPRVILLLAAGLLVAAELVSVSLLLRGIAEHRSQKVAVAQDRATALIPRIAEWAKARDSQPGERLQALWIEPFDSLTIEDPGSLNLSEEDRRRLEDGEFVVASLPSDAVTSLLGSVRVDQSPVVFRLTEPAVDPSRLATDQTLIAQHGLILLCALAGFVLAAFARSPAQSDLGSPTLRAYEEAMTRLRLRDDARLASFDREKLALAAVLKDKEAMARAGELTAGIVHEVRNSLGVIAARARSAQQSGDPRVQTAAASIDEEVRTLQSVMTRFVDFIRTENVQWAEFDLAKLAERVAARERPNHGTSIAVMGDPTLVRGDEDLLERAIENLVRNACQASGPEGAVTIREGADSTHAFVIVEDNGPGFLDVERALRPFESARPGGLGLGLPLVLKIMTLHQGTLDFGPGPGQRGTQVVCRWPRTADDVTGGNEESPHPLADGKP